MQRSAWLINRRLRARVALPKASEERQYVHNTLDQGVCIFLQLVLAELWTMPVVLSSSTWLGVTPGWTAGAELSPRCNRDACRFHRGTKLWRSLCDMHRAYIAIPQAYSHSQTLLKDISSPSLLWSLEGAEICECYSPGVDILIRPPGAAARAISPRP